MKKQYLLFFALFCACFFPVLAYGQTTVAPYLTSEVQIFDNNGKALSGGCVFFFAAGTNTPQPTFTDSTGTVQATNPVVLDSAGRAAIWMSGLSYKIQVKTSGGVNCASGSQLWVQDNVTWTTPLSTFAGLSVSGNFNITQPTAATGGANQSSFTDCLQASYWTGAASATDKWCWQDVLGTGSNPTSTYTLTHTGSSGASLMNLPVIQTVTAKSVGGIFYVAPGNPQGWAGSDYGQWINSAFTACGACVVYVQDGSYANTSTTITVPTKSVLFFGVQGLTSSPSVNCPNTTNPCAIQLAGPDSAIQGLEPTTTSFISCTSANCTDVNIAAQCNACRLENVGFGGGGGAQKNVIQIQDNQRELYFRHLTLTPSGGECIQYIPGATGGELLLLENVICAGSTGKAFDFNLGGSTGFVSLTFINTYADGVTGGVGVGYDLAQVTATLINTAVDLTTVGYRVPASTTIGTITWINCDDEVNTTGYSILGQGTFNIYGGQSDNDGTPISINAAGANTNIQFHKTIGTTNANSIVYAVASTAGHNLMGEEMLDKVISIAGGGPFVRRASSLLTVLQGPVGINGTPTAGRALDINCPSLDCVNGVQRAGSTDYTWGSENGAGNDVSGSGIGDYFLRALTNGISFGTGASRWLRFDSNGNSTFSATGLMNTAGSKVELTADWTCGTGGTVASCVSAAIIGSGGGVPLTFTLPLVLASWEIDCDLNVGQATAPTANNWNLITATNAPTNTAASFSMATAAAAYAGGSTTGNSSTTTFNIGGTWTLGGTGTKMPAHIHASVQGASVSGTVVSLQLVAPTVGDLVTIFRGSGCSIH